MNENRIKNQIEAALCEPSAPEELIQRTVRRAQIITRGRAAEGELEQRNAELSADETAQLAAAGLIGRLAMTTELPGHISQQEMVGQLSADPHFRRQLDRPVDELLKNLRSGELLREVATSVRVATPAARGKEAEKQKPSAEHSAAAKDILPPTRK